MHLRSQTWLNLLLGLLAALVVINGGVAYYNLRQLRLDTQLVAQTHGVLIALERVVTTVAEAESGERGFLLTGDASFMVPYERASARVDAELKQLDAATRGTPRLAEQLTQLEELARERLQQLARNIALRKDGEVDQARQMVIREQGQRTMEDFRALAVAIGRDQHASLAEREAADARAYRTGVAGILVSSVAGIGALAMVLVLLRRHLKSLLHFSAEIHDQRELLRATLKSIGDGVIVTDLSGRVLFLNAVAERLTGWSQAEAAGSELAQVFVVNRASTGEPVANLVERVQRESSIVKLSSDAELTSRDGTVWPIDDSAASILTADGRAGGAVLVFREISQQKRHEQALLEHTAAVQSANARMQQLVEDLRSSEELFHSMVDSIPQLAWMAGPDGQPYWYNRRWYEYTGGTPSKSQSDGWQAVVGDGEAARVAANWKSAVAAGQPWEDTVPLRRHDGAVRWHLSQSVPLRNERGQIVRWLGTHTDITERLEMEQALREADHRKDEFLATLAHELRNPIAPISNALQVWPLVADDREEVDKLRAIMERQVRQMSRLIDDLLDVSRITRGKIQLRRQPLELSTVISAAVEAISPLVESYRHELEVITGETPLVVDGDVARLTQVIGNLLHNAAKYTPAGGKIRVELLRSGNHAEVHVIDNGAGIPAEMLERIFEMFQQVDQTLDRSHGGLGLGLTLVQRLVELHGGRVEARSAGEGQGSQFVVRLPLVESTRKSAGTETPMNSSRKLARHRVLVVDDVYASAKTLAMMLESINQQVTIANDGPTAIEKALAERPDIVFLDIAMPGMNGYDVARAMREKPELQAVKLVALTGYGNEDDRRQAIEAGFDHHLTKPASIDQLVHLLHGLPGISEESESILSATRPE